MKHTNNGNQINRVSVSWTLQDNYANGFWEREGVIGERKHWDELQPDGRNREDISKSNWLPRSMANIITWASRPASLLSISSLHVLLKGHSTNDRSTYHDGQGLFSKRRSLFKLDIFSIGNVVWASEKLVDWTFHWYPIVWCSKLCFEKLWD